MHAAGCGSGTGAGRGAGEGWRAGGEGGGRLCARWLPRAPYSRDSLPALPPATSQQTASFPLLAPSQYTQTPWRCFAVDAGSTVPGANGVQERGDHFFVGQHDNAAITWVQGLQSLLHASGQLEQPLPPAKLLWLRARMRLLQRAVRHKSHASATLAAVVQSAVKKSATTRRG